MSKHVKYVPKHRQTTSRTLAAQAPKKALRTGLVLSSVAAGVTGVAVAGGTLGAPVTDVTAAAADATPEDQAVTAAAAAAASAARAGTEVEQVERPGVISRSDRRQPTDPGKEAVLEQQEGGAITVTEDLSDEDPRTIARVLLGEYGFSADQLSCLDALYVSESDWGIDADNPTSSAYGIPQALTQLHDLPADYMTSAESQIRWGLDYIRDSYGSPCSAWSFKRANNWY